MAVVYKAEFQEQSIIRIMPDGTQDKSPINRAEDKGENLQLILKAQGSEFNLPSDDMLLARKSGYICALFVSVNFSEYVCIFILTGFAGWTGLISIL